LRDWLSHPLQEEVEGLIISRVHSGAVLGIDGYSIEAEVNLATGIPCMSIVGLPDAAVKESSDRVEAAIKNTNLDMPLKKITVNLAPADIKKEGSAFDLPIAIGILAANGLIDKEALSKYMILGELSLDGRVKRIKGALSIATQARESGLEGLLLPAENCAEAAVVEGVNVYPVNDLPAVEYKDLSSNTVGEPSSAIRERVERTRQLQLERFQQSKIYFNAGMTTQQLQKHCRLDDASQKIMALAIDILGLSARAHDRILKVSRTIADLAGEADISVEHVSEAIQYRSLDRESWI